MLTPDEIEGSTRPTVERVIAGLETGEFRVAEPDGKGGWTVNEWLKKAVLLYFRVNDMQLIEALRRRRSGTRSRRASRASTRPHFRKLGARVVPGAIVRRGAHIGKDVVLMPSFVNIGAHVGDGTMVDTWATVGSCAQIGKHCHLSGGAGIGGVLEPLQASPDDHRGPLLHRRALGSGRRRGRRPPQRDRHGRVPRPVARASTTARPARSRYGYVPPGSVVVSGSLPAEGRVALAVLRGDRQAGRREDACRRPASTSCCAGWRTEPNAAYPRSRQFPRSVAGTSSACASTERRWILRLRGDDDATRRRHTGA